MTGHDEPTTAIGPAPKPGQPEASACWRAAWTALGRDDAGREEAEMSDGQLRIRVRAWERERTWAPRYVANELAGTHQAARDQRSLASLRHAEADFADGADSDRLRTEADQATALGDVLGVRCAELTDADEARTLWYAHTAPTRAAAERAAAELAGRDTAPSEPAVTAEQWLAEHRAADAQLDPHRVITAESDFAEVNLERRQQITALTGAVPVAVIDTEAPPPERSTVSEDVVRVPTAEETARTVARARHALAEIERRRLHDEARTAEEQRTAQLARWTDEDRATTRDRNRTLERI
jgi:hypothetical protein